MHTSDTAATAYFLVKGPWTWVLVGQFADLTLTAVSLVLHPKRDIAQRNGL